MPVNSMRSNGRPVPCRCKSIDCPCYCPKVGKATCGQRPTVAAVKAKVMSGKATAAVPASVRTVPNSSVTNSWPGPSCTRPDSSNKVVDDVTTPQMIPRTGQRSMNKAINCIMNVRRVRHHPSSRPWSSSRPCPSIMNDMRATACPFESSSRYAVPGK